MGSRTDAAAFCEVLQGCVERAEAVTLWGVNYVPEADADALRAEVASLKGLCRELWAFADVAEHATVGEWGRMRSRLQDAGVVV